MVIKMRTFQQKIISNSKFHISCFVFISCLLTQEAQGYCWEPGKNPGFTGPPKVEQLDISTVRVSWVDLVKMRECADQFLVKYWQRSNPHTYETSDLLSRNANSVDLKVVPKVDYQFQAVAREDKGVIGGIDWNKSPITDFKTSAKKPPIYQPPPPLDNSLPILEQPNSNKGSGSTLYQPQPTSSISESDDVNQGGGEGSISESEPQESPFPITIEILAIIIVAGVAVLLILVGIVYKLFCVKKTDMDDDDEEDQEKGKTKGSRRYDDEDDDSSDDDDDDDDDDDVKERERFNTT